ncbi:MAG: hypothetical protein R3F56_17520 [Planctomycetota bacterium]
MNWSTRSGIPPLSLLALPACFGLTASGRAQYPVTSTEHAFVRSDVGYLGSSDRYLVVWSIQETRGVGPVRARLTDGTGRPFGPTIDLGALGTGPRVAAVYARGRFVVVWGDVDDVPHLVSVDGRTGAVSPEVVLSAPVRSYAVSGEATQVFGDALLAYANDGGTFVRRVSVLSDGRLDLRDRVQIDEHSSDVSMPRSGGSTGRYLVIAANSFTGSDGRTVVCHGVVVDRSLRVLDPSVAIFRNYTPAMEVDGDGQNWLVAWSTLRDPRALVSPVEVLGLSITFDAVGGSAYPSAAPRLFEHGLAPSTHPYVAWLGESAVMSLLIGGRPVRHSIDPVVCDTCETRRVFFAPVDASSGGAVASKLSGGNFAEPASYVIAYSGDASEGETRLTALLSQPSGGRDGRTTAMGGGCSYGTPMVVDVGCARTDATMSLRLRGARPGVGCWAQISNRTHYITCGACMIVPDLSGPTFVTETDVHGVALARLFVPDLASTLGTTLYAQWFVSGGPPTSCLYLETSPAVSVVVE